MTKLLQITVHLEIFPLEKVIPTTNLLWPLEIVLSCIFRFLHFRIFAFPFSSTERPREEDMIAKPENLDEMEKDATQLEQLEDPTSPQSIEEKPINNRITLIVKTAIPNKVFKKEIKQVESTDLRERKADHNGKCKLAITTNRFLVSSRRYL